MGAVPFHKYKAPSVDIQEGDPPLGKERGTLGVGTGPTPPHQANNDPPVTPKPLITKNEDNIILKTTSKKLILKPPSTQQKPGLKQTRKRRLPEPTPANQRKISSLFKPTPKLPNTTMVSNPCTATDSNEIAKSAAHEGQSQNSLVDRQKPHQKPEHTELKSKVFIEQDQNTCPDLGEINL